jgi:4-hydroxymandelate oxidase
MTYFRQGAGAGLSAAEAEAQWDAVRLLPHVLRDVSDVSTRTSVLGCAIGTPLLVAPTTLQRQAHEEGEAAMLRGAAAAGSLVCVSGNAGVPFTTLAGSGPWWVQAYVLRDRGLTAELLARARQAGATAVVLTADTPVVGEKHGTGPSVWDTVPDDHLMANIAWQGVADARLEKAADLTPATIDWLRTTTGLPVVVKGVLRADDARACVAAGASAVWVSNHGGRQLDGALATARALRPVADALAGTGAELYVDGGVRTGRHALIALALGATAVFVGRPTLWALAVDGAAGVTRLLTELTAELAHAMALAGAPDLASLTPDLVSD